MEEKVNERITIRLPEETLSQVEDFMRVNGMNNRSEFIRMAVEYFMERHRGMFIEGLKFEEIKVRLPWRAALAIEYLDREGYILMDSLLGVLQETASEWVNNKAKSYVGTSLDDVLNRFAEEIKAEREVMDIVRK